MNAVELPWPPRELSPNARVHFRTKAAATKAYREQCYWLSRAADWSVPESGELTLRIDFHPPDKRRRDLDGMFASLKAGIDGLADSLFVNDYRFAFQIARREPTKRGKIVISLVATAP